MWNFLTKTLFASDFKVSSDRYSDYENALEDSTALYADSMTALEKSMPNPSSQEILAVLTARDLIQAQILSRSYLSKDYLLKIKDLDDRLRTKSKIVSEVIELESWRLIINAPKDAWWWFLEDTTNAPAWTRLEWPWNTLTIVCLAINFSFVTDIAPRFFSGGPNLIGAFAVVSQSLLTLISAGILTETGKKSIQNIFKWFKLPKYFWVPAQFGFSLLISLSLLYLYISLPSIARFYNGRGVQNYTNDKFSSAIDDFNRALEIYPDFPEAHYNLGRIYDDLQDFSRSQSEYLLAVQGGDIPAYSTLARIYILTGKQENYEKAVFFLTQGLMRSEGSAKYDFLKNLGWVRFKQKRLETAKIHLQDAIKIKQNEGAAYCLYALVLEEMGDNSGALGWWEKCLKYASKCRRDEDTWIGLASQRLKVQEPIDLPCPERKGF